MRLLGFLLLFFVYQVKGQDLTFIGNIGNYPIEFIIESTSWETGEFKGKYRYTHKDKYLSLKGKVYGDFIYIEEFYKGESTGKFYLEIMKNQLTGRWIGNQKCFNVVVSDKDDQLWSKLRVKSISDYVKQTNLSTTGTYRNQNYYINEMWFTEENPNLEIGFSGGDLGLEKLNEDSLHFQVEVVCGPTYHIAYAQGVATKIEENKYECLYNIYKEDTCMIWIETSERGARAWAKWSMACEFGARAYLDHEFTKVSDTVNFDEKY